MRERVSRLTIGWVTSSLRVPILLLTAALAACGPTEALRVETIQLGRSLNPDNSVAGHTTTFKPLDTMYVSVLTPEKGRGTIGVRWMYEGRLVGEPSQDVVYRGAAATEFHIQNSSGFPPATTASRSFSTANRSASATTASTRPERLAKLRLTPPGDADRSRMPDGAVVGTNSTRWLTITSSSR